MALFGGDDEGVIELQKNVDRFVDREAGVVVYTRRVNGGVALTAVPLSETDLPAGDGPGSR